MANRYWVGGTDTWNATAGTKWALTSGGAGGQTVPTTADDVFFDGASGAGTITTSASTTCRAINFTGFTGTFNMAANWSAAGSVTFVNTMTLTGTATLSKVLNNAVNYISNGLPFTGSLNIGNVSGTILYDDWNIAGSWTSTATSLQIGSTSTTKTITVGTNVSATSCNSGNTITFLMSGTGTLVGTFTTTIINIAGAITQSGTLTFNGSTFTFTSGSYTASAIRFGTGNTTFNNVSTLTFTTLENFGGNPTITLNSDLSCSDISFTVTTTINSASNKLLVRGNIANNINLVGSGTATIEMTGSTPATIGNGTIQNNLIINKSSGASVTLTGSLILGLTGRFLTMNTNMLFGVTTLTIVGATFTINNSSGSSFYNFTNTTANAVITLNNPITITNNHTVSVNTQFAGTAGWTNANMLCTTGAAAIQITLQNSVTYRTTTSCNMLGSASFRVFMTSNDAAILTIWTLDQGATQSMVYVNGIRVDSSLGQTIWTFLGVLTSTINWNIGARPAPYGYISFS